MFDALPSPNCSLHTQSFIGIFKYTARHSGANRDQQTGSEIVNFEHDRNGGCTLQRTRALKHTRSNLNFVTRPQSRRGNYPLHAKRTNKHSPRTQTYTFYRLILCYELVSDRRQSTVEKVVTVHATRLNVMFAGNYRPAVRHPWYGYTIVSTRNDSDDTKLATRSRTLRNSSRERDLSPVRTRRTWRGETRETGWLEITGCNVHDSPAAVDATLEKIGARLPPPDTRRRTPAPFAAVTTSHEISCNSTQRASLFHEHFVNGCAAVSLCRMSLASSVLHRNLIT